MLMIGRKLLASGALTFKKWVIGDSEIDYTFASNTDFDLTESMILRPKDLNPNIKYPVLPTENASTQYNNIGTIVPIEVKVRNTAIERGLFSGNTTTGFTAKTDYNSVIQNKLKIDLTDVNGGTTIAVKQDTGFSLYSEPIIGDYLFIQWNVSAKRKNARSSDNGAGKSAAAGFVDPHGQHGHLDGDSPLLKRCGWCHGYKW
jgi:hypothetical protein